MLRRYKVGHAEEPLRRGRLEETLLRVVSAFGALLGRGLDRLGRMDPSAWVAGLTGWVDRLTHRDRQWPSVRAKEPAASSAAGPASSEPLKRPPPVNELPVLRFAEVHEPRDVEDVYEDEGGESLFHTAWLWTKRIVVMTALVMGGILAALTWETWLPKAKKLGQLVLTEIDRRTSSMEQTERQQRALLEATDQLPHHAPETIRLVLAGTPGGALDPPGGFLLACEAADRGLSALTAGEGKELKALQRELLDTLGPAERERVREFDRARAYRLTFEFENRRVVEAFARGAPAMSSRSRARLQALLGKAIAAGLVLPTEVAPRSTAKS